MDETMSAGGPIRTVTAGKSAMKLPFVRRAASPRATVYSKADCPLCREAEHAVRATFGSQRVDVVDIIGDRELEDAYIFRIPVLVVDGSVLAEGRITMTEARAAYRIALARLRSSERT